MGSAVESLAAAGGHEIVARFNRRQPLRDGSLLSNANVAIDFSLPDAAVANIETCVHAAVPVIVGTTGWFDQLPRVRELVNSKASAVLYSPNFSLGIQLVEQALRAAAKLLNQMPEYDVAVHEVHHTRKIDRPSGTAIKLADTVLKNLNRKTRWAASASGDPQVLETTSLRVGATIGRHEVIMDSPVDVVTFTHQAKSRRGFAMGALKAAEWIQGKTGLLTLEDMLSEWAAS